MKIIAVECHRVWVDATHLNWILTLIRTDAGLTGLSGVIMRRHEFTVREAVLELRAYLIGKDPLRSTAEGRQGRAFSPSARTVCVALPWASLWADNAPQPARPATRAHPCRYQEGGRACPRLRSVSGSRV